MPRASRTPKVSSQETEANIKRGSAELVQETVHVVPPVPGASASVLPAIPGVTDEQPVELHAHAQAGLEYIVSTHPRLSLQFTPNSVLSPNKGFHQLPTYIDELERDFGTDIYLRLLNDAAVKAGDAVLRASILDKPLTLSLGIDEKTEKDAKKKELAGDVLEFCEAALDYMDN